jgi:hypothetical protein
MVHVLVIVCKLLAVAALLAVFVIAIRFMFPKSAPRVRGTVIAYAGGFRSKMWTGSWGTVVLELGDRDMTIRGRGPFRPFVNRHARYSEVLRARAVRSVGVAGLLLSTADGPIAFWTPRASEILDLLELQGVPVDRAATKVRSKDFG